MLKNGLDQKISRGLAYLNCDLIWCETKKPNLEEYKNLPKQFIINFLETFSLQLFSIF